MKKITRKALLTAKAYRPGKAGGGLLGGYTDPKTKNLEDWQWKPLADVQAKLGGLSEIPSHVLSFGQFMDQTAQRAAREGLRPRDLIKAYTITRASIQRQAINSDKLRAAGFDLPPNITGKIRPEGAFGEWLHSPAGQSYLDAAEKGQQHEAAIQNAAQVMKPFGKDNDLIDALRWAAGNLPGKEGQVSQLVAAGREKASTPDEWRAFTKNIRGIGPSKSGFVASLMGRGDQPTLDARQIILHTGNPAKEASRYVARKGGEGGAEAVNRLATRQEAMNLSLPQELSPYYQHLAHHAVWDKAGDEETTHQDVMQAMQHAATGGKIEPNHVSTHPVAQIMSAMGFPGLETEAHKADGGEIDDWHGVHEREAQHFADGGVAGTPKKTVKAYKLFKTKKNAPGKLFPLFVDANTPVPVGQWVDAKAGEPGKTPGKVKSKLGDLAFRPGWHAGDLPIATHIGGRSSDEQGAPPDYRPADQVWAEVEMPDDVDWQSVANSRGQRTKAGTIDPKTAHITDQVPAGGHYRYKTNPNMTGNWMIGGSMRVNRILSDDEVKSINDAAGAADLPRHPDYPKMATGGRAGYADGGSTGKLPARVVNFKNFYSRGAEAARQLSQKKGSPQQMRAMLVKAGVKPEEFTQSGFDEAFSGKPSVTSEELFQHFYSKMPNIGVDKLLSEDHSSYDASDPDAEQPAQFEDYTLPGSVNYREHLLKLPETSYSFREQKHWPGHKNVVAHIRMGDRIEPPDLEAHDRTVEKMLSDPSLTQSLGAEPANWGSGAADLALSKGTITKEEAQNLSRAKGWRNNVMKGYKAPRALHVEEIQSDWAQAGRKHGFQGSKDGYDKPPQGPFVNSTQGWTSLALKHALTEAASGGYNKLVLSPGQANADMYGLDGEQGSGMKSFYDQILPTQMNKLAKSLDPDHPGVQMFSHALPSASGGDDTEGYKGHALEITDGLRDAVKKGLPMYKRGGMALNDNPMVHKAIALARNLTRR